MKKPILRALRGAVCSANTAEEISARAAELYDKLLSENSLEEKDLVSLFFSVTRDLDAQNPASALRLSGKAGMTPMMVFQEAEFKDSLPGTIRILMHCYMDSDIPFQYIYLHGAEILRSDRTGNACN